MQTIKEKEVIYIHNPYDYFDAELYKYAIEGESLLFGDDMIQQMKHKTPNEFLLWLQSIHFYPLINPITAQLDSKKNIDKVIDMLQSHDYVVPYEAISEFFEHVDSQVLAPKPLSPSMDFSISQVTDKELIDAFIGRDIQIYETAKKLWEIIRHNNFKPLEKPKKYEGLVDKISPTIIAGWIFDIDSPESQTVYIYKNDILIEKVYANMLRPGIKKNKKHPTGLCGFQIKFSYPTFSSSDTIQVSTEDGTFILSFTKEVHSFFNSIRYNKKLDTRYNEK